jgi:hypothetical protein
VAENRWSKFAALALSSVALLAAAPIAGAEGEEDTGGFGTFRLKGTNGFSILVMGFSGPHFKRGEVVIFATGKNEAAIYSAPARVTATEIDADLGALGEISVWFEASGPPERVPSSCGEGAAVYEPGTWQGVIEFEGEQGFTKARRSRTKAILSPFFEPDCGGHSIGEEFGHRVRGARLIARSVTRSRSLFLQANQNRRGAPVHVEASLKERRGRMNVTRLVTDGYPGDSFGFDRMLRVATLAPPAPFSGSSSFHRDAKRANRWTGSLTLDFPGRSDVPLDGRAFHTSLVPAQRTEQRTRRDRLSRSSLIRWLSTKPSPIASATSLPLGPS